MDILISKKKMFRVVSLSEVLEGYDEGPKQQSLRQVTLLFSIKISLYSHSISSGLVWGCVRLS